MLVEMKKNKDYLYVDSSDNGESSHQSKFIIPKTSRIDYLISEEKYSQALALIEKTLKKDDLEYWTLKADILVNQKEYEQAIDCYNKSLLINQSAEINKNKADALYKWAKISYFPELKYEKALNLVDDALKTIPESEDSSEYYFLKGEILEALQEPIEAKKSYLIAYKEFEKLAEFEKQVEYLKTTEDTLVNITGSYFYDFTPSNDLIVDLIKEPDNEHDPDAIAAYLDGEKIGYIANSDYTLIDFVKSATKIKNIVDDNSKAQILFVYLDQYIIAKII